MKSIPYFFLSEVHFSVTNFFSFHTKRLLPIFMFGRAQKNNFFRIYFSDQKETLGLLNYRRNKYI
jgi:hypothetical protein